MKNSIAYKLLKNEIDSNKDNPTIKTTDPKRRKRKPQSRASIMFFGPRIDSDTSDSENK